MFKQLGHLWRHPLQHVLLLAVHSSRSNSETQYLRKCQWHMDVVKITKNLWIFQLVFKIKFEFIFHIYAHVKQKYSTKNSEEYHRHIYDKWLKLYIHRQSSVRTLFQLQVELFIFINKSKKCALTSAQFLCILNSTWKLVEIHNIIKKNATFCERVKYETCATIKDSLIGKASHPVKIGT